MLGKIVGDHLKEKIRGLIPRKLKHGIEQGLHGKG